VGNDQVRDEGKEEPHALFCSLCFVGHEEEEEGDG